MARKDLFERIDDDRDILVQLRLHTNVARKSIPKLREMGLVATGGAGMEHLGTVRSVKLIESLGDDVARAEKRGRDKAKAKR
jgi:hypothetical protein